VSLQDGGPRRCPVLIVTGVLFVLVVLGAAASFFALSSTVPQIHRAFRAGSAAGVSWGSLLLNLSSAVWWGVYSVFVSDHVLLAYNVVAVGLFLVLAVVLVLAEGRSGWSWVLAGAFPVAVAVAATVTVAASPLALALFGTVITSVRMWPQARLALARVPLWGLDPWATALGWVGGLLWVTYGLAVGDFAMALSSIVALWLQTIVAAFRLPPRRTLHSIAHGRLGPVAAQLAGSVAVRFPVRADEFTLIA
jgi:uncharacterized protein with PQ loop repeat